MKYYKYACLLIFIIIYYNSVINAQVPLIAHYKLDGNLKDEKGLSDGHFATGGATGVIDTVGYDGTQKGALLFGAGATTWYRVDLGNYSPSQLGTKDEMTCAFWAYWKGSTGTFQDIINKRDDWHNDGMMWGINQHRATGHKLSVRIPGFEADSKTAIPLRKWTHVVITMSVNKVRFYVNGVKKDELSWRFGTKTNANIHIGTSPNGLADAYNGALDDIRFYSRVLSDNEIDTLYSELAKNLVDPISIDISPNSAAGTSVRNYPNPFNSITSIEYSIINNTQVEIFVCDLSGRKVADLVNEYKDPGTYNVVWDASGLLPGFYICQLKTKDFILSKKMEYIR
ncbi:MAG: LamG-like jellyroll fold domain-containing protein [Bacteroidales bacterium]